MTKKQKTNEAKAILKQTARNLQQALEMLPTDTNQFAINELYDAYGKLISAAAWLAGPKK